MNKLIILVAIIFFLTSGYIFKTIGMYDYNIQIDNNTNQINQIDKNNSNVYSNQIEYSKSLNDNPEYMNNLEGKKDLFLANKIKNAGPNDKFKVGIWLKEKNDSRDIVRSDISADSIDLIEKNKISAIAKLKIKTYNNQKALLNYLTYRNTRILFSSMYAPLVIAELSKIDIQEIEKRDDVSSLQSEVEYQEAISNSVPSVLAPPVWNNINGGAKVAIVEDDGVAFANPYLKTGLYFNNTNPNIRYHATGIAGIISSNDSNLRGIAYNGPALLSANSQTLNDGDLMNATEWALDNSANILSNSWELNNGGNWTLMTSYLDYIGSHFPWPTIIFAAGNCGSCPYPYNIVGAPALGYNLIAVGSYDDKGTGWQWSDDTMSYFSSYGNPPSSHHDRQKPEVVAVGNHSATGYNGILSTIPISPWKGNIGWGTSFSAPEVAGEASLLMNKSPALAIWPEAVRSIIMASADHNIEGNSRLSDKDGTGGIDILEAYNIVNKGKGIGWDANTLYYNSGNPWYWPNISANTGQKIRVVIAWDSNSTGINDTLDADLDLFIQRFNSNSWIDETRAGYSNSADNNYEIVEFNAPSTGIYRAKVIKYRWDNKNSSEYVGYASYVK